MDIPLNKPSALEQLFPNPKPLIGTVHCEPLPGTPRYKDNSVEYVIERAIQDAYAYVDGGMDGLIIENHGDIPFLRPEDIGHEITAVMAVIAREVTKVVKVPIGINLLANDACGALAVAKAAGAQFIRVNQWANAYVANEGFVQGDSAKALRYRKQISAENVLIFADVHVKHGAHAVVADRSLSELARDVEFFDANVAIATGNRTGDTVPDDEINGIREGTSLPIVTGSGLTAENALHILGIADGAIVGSSLKRGGVWWNPVERGQVEALVAIADELRQQPH